MIKYFDLDSNQIRIRDILTDKPFFEIEIYAISNAKPNRNKSYFTPEAMKKGMETFTDKPILGFFNKQNDFESHNGKPAYDPELEKEFWDNSNGEQILGFVRQSDHKEIVEGSDGLLWIVCTAMICSQYNYKQVKRLLKDKHKKVSVEISVKESEVIDGIEYIYDFELMGITILGSKNGIPVREGIEGAHLSVLDMFDEKVFNSQRQALVFAYSQLDDNKNKEDKDLAKDDIGTKNALKIDKTKEAMSDTKWGNVDKTELRNRVVAASNFKEIAGDVFLDLREGWEDGETSKLKYPVMQIVNDDTLVYNRDALASAKAYAEKNSEDKVLETLKSIYKHLDLDFESEAKMECDQFCDLYEDDCGDCGHGDGEGHGDDEHGHGDDDEHGHGDDGHDDGEGCHMNADDNKDQAPENKPEENKENNSENTSDNTDASKDDNKSDDNDQAKDDDKSKEDMSDDNKTDNNFTIEQLMEFKLNLEKECGDLKMKCESVEQKCAELEEKCCKYEATISEYNEKYKDYDVIKSELNAANEKFAVIKTDEQKAYIKNIENKMSLMSEDTKDILAKCEKREYSSNAEIDKDIAYVVFQKKMATMNDKTAEFSVNIVPETSANKSAHVKTIQERLAENVKYKINNN